LAAFAVAFPGTFVAPVAARLPRAQNLAHAGREGRPVGLRHVRGVVDDPLFDVGPDADVDLAALGSFWSIAAVSGFGSAIAPHAATRSARLRSVSAFTSSRTSRNIRRMLRRAAAASRRWQNSAPICLGGVDCPAIRLPSAITPAPAPIRKRFSAREAISPMTSQRGASAHRRVVGRIGQRADIAAGWAGRP